MGRGGERRPDRSHDLDVLDPVTGELVPSDDPRARDAVRPEGPAKRRRRLRRVTALLVVLSLASSTGAAMFAWTITSLRAIDRTWAEAMAVDRARKAADAAVLGLARELGDGGTDEVRRAALGRIGDEATDRLLRHEAELRRRWILDDRVDVVRDDMLEALRFRRFQLSPNRSILGDTPLQRVEDALEQQLDRFGFERSTAPLPELRSVGAALGELRRFADEPTGTVLAAAAGRRLLTIDVDSSTVRSRALPAEAVDLVGGLDLAVVRGADGFVTAYPVDPGAPAAWRIEGTTVVTAWPAATPRDVAVWVDVPGAGVVPAATDGPRPPVPVPVGSELLADTEEGLLLRDPTTGRFHVHDRQTGAAVRTLPIDGRFAGASGAFVAVQSPGRPVLVVHRLADGSAFELPLPRTDAGGVVQAPGREVFAFAAGPIAGNIASVLLIDDDGWALVGLGGPRVTIRPNAMAWSTDGEHLFWATPDGRIAHDGRDDPLVLRAPVDGVTHVAAFTAPRRR